jgi:hypothetical protein
MGATRGRYLKQHSDAHRVRACHEILAETDAKLTRGLLHRSVRNLAPDPSDTPPTDSAMLRRRTNRVALSTTNDPARTFSPSATDSTGAGCESSDLCQL